MGIELAGIVSAKYGHIPAGPYKILMRMAITALDKPNAKGQPPRLYWGGWEDLAIALGRDVPPPLATIEKHHETTRRRKVIRNEVIRYTTYLTTIGAVEKAVDNPRVGYQQEWKLTLDEGIQIVRPQAHDL